MTAAADTLALLLDELEALLARQSDAIRHGEGDALAQLANLLTARLGRLSAWASDSRMPSFARMRLARLRARARANQDALNLRLTDVQRSLDALGIGNSGQNGRLYAEEGGLTRLPGRGRGVVRA